MSIQVNKNIATICLSLTLGTAYAGQFGDNRVGLELLQLERDTDQDITYVWDNNGGGGHANDIPLGSTGRFDDTADLGFRISGAKRINTKWSIQAGYMTTGELSETQSFSDPLSRLDVFWNGITQEFDSADTVQASYSSELDGLEINAVYALSDMIDVFGGIGSLNLDEKFRIRSDDFSLPGVGQYNISTSNELLGPQLGINLAYPATNKLGLYLMAKLGWYNNDSQQHQTVSDPVVIANRDVTVSDDTSSTAYEINLGGTYNFSQNLRMKLGYQFLKVTDVALAESQFDILTGGTTLKNDDEITWQGLQLGINYYF